MKPNDVVRAFYDDAATGYSQMMDEEITLPIYDEVLSGLVDSIQGLDGAILDTSCGSGHMMEKLRDTYGVPNPLIGVDLSPNMVELSRKRLGDSGSIIEADMQDLHVLPDCGCAAVISFFSLHHIDSGLLEPCFKEWHRVLIPGGKLVIATWEGEGPINYGVETDLPAQRLRYSEVEKALISSGFEVNDHSIQAVEDLEMDAVYISASCALVGEKETGTQT